MSSKYLTMLASAVVCLWANAAFCQIITTVVSGTNIGDGNSALNAAFGGPTSVCFDKKGNTFIMDTDDYRIRKIDTNGIVTTLAGNGEIGITGDGGPATNAQISTPYSLAVDEIDNIYFSDYQNHCIRKVDTNGIITTVAGSSLQGFSGDGGPATNARLNYPKYVIFDKTGNLYIADTQNNRIRKVDASGIITTVVGNGTSGFGGDGGLATNAQLNSPQAIAIDDNNNLYIVDASNFRIRKVDASGIITTVAGNGAYQYVGDGGQAVNSPLYYPVDVAVDATGTLFISQQDGRVRKVTGEGIILAVAGNGTNGFSGDGGLAVNALISSSTGVDVDATGNVYIADRDNYRIRRITSDGVIQTVAGGFTGDGGNATNAFFRKLLFKTPSTLTIDSQGNLYVPDRFANRIRKITPDGIITTIAGNGVNGYAGDGDQATNAQLRHPRSVGFDSTGHLYVADQYNSCIRKIDLNKVITTVAGDGRSNFFGGALGSSADIYNSSGIAVAKSGIVYVPTSNCVLKITTTGIISIVAGLTASTGYSGDGGLATNAQLNNPTGVALDSAGNLYIADYFNNRIRKVDANGIMSTVVGNGSSSYGAESILATNSPLNRPYELAFGPDGTMYVTESGFSRVRQINRNGIITTVAGNGSSGFGGDGGSATNARLSNPGGVAIDLAGNLYIADTGNRRVRKVTYPIRPTLAVSGPLNCSTTSLTLTAKPAGSGFTYQFSPGATQIGSTNQAIISTGGTYSVTVSTSLFGSPAGQTSITVSGNGFYTIKPGNWNDPSVWACGTVPGAGQQAHVLHTIDIPLNYQAVAGTVQYETGGSLRFATGAYLQLSP